VAIIAHRLNGFGWQNAWDNFTGPQAKAWASDAHAVGDMP
jgi:hypothetical protein